MANIISHTFFKLNGHERGLLGLVDYNSTSALSDHKQQKLAAIAEMRNFFGPQSKIFSPRTQCTIVKVTLRVICTSFLGLVPIP